MQYLFDNIFEVSSEKDIDEEVGKLFSYYREHGFPNYEKERYSIRQEYDKLSHFDENTIFNSDLMEIGQSMTGCGILWTYFPHWIDVECGNSPSISESWKDDEKLKKLLKKTYIWKLKHNEKVWTSNRIRQNAKVYLAKQSVSNFRPTVAKFLYNRYGNNGRVFDMSCGFGGRLFGFHSSKCREYVGCEPSTKTFQGLLCLNEDLHDMTGKKAEILHQGSEIYIDGMEGSFDMCFTSPPYFNTEKYSEEPTQSYLKYPTIECWTNGFLSDTISNCHKYLKDNGFLVINIANIKGYELEKITCDVAAKNGFILYEKLFMVLSSIAGRGKKYEPVFVFKKV